MGAAEGVSIDALSMSEDLSLFCGLCSEPEMDALRRSLFGLRPGVVLRLESVSSCGF